MIWHIMKKQALIFWRNPTELILLLALPMLLIVILSLSLGSFFNSNEVNLDVKVGMIDEGETDKQLQDFEKMLDEKDIPKDDQQAILQGAKSFNPVEIFREGVLGEMGDSVEVQALDLSEKSTALEDEDYTAVIEVPDDFLLKTWQHSFLDGEDIGTWQIDYNQEAGTDGSVIKEAISQFQEQLTLSQYAVQEGKSPETFFESSENFGKEKTLDGNNIVETKEYYTIGMVVMNVLFMASAISSFAFMEKEKHIFNRIILANVTGKTYFTGIFLATTVFAFLQMLLIFTFAWLVFDVSWSNMGTFFIITAALACAVGGMAVLLSIIAYRIKSETIINMFGSIIVSVLAFIGGSFFPIGDFSDVFQTMGNYTPNGAAMTAYLELLKGNDGFTIWKHVFVLVGFSVALLGVAIGLYPKRGQQI